MNQLETSNDKITIDAKPLFASAWIALYEQLRRNYYARQVAVDVDPGNLQAKTNKAREKD